MKMELTECSKTLAYKILDAGELPRRKHTKNNIMSLHYKERNIFKYIIFYI
jgi:hypothetical protein